MLAEIARLVEEKLELIIKDVEEYSEVRKSLEKLKPFKWDARDISKLIRADGSALKILGELAIPIDPDEWRRVSIPPGDARRERRGRLILGLDSSWINPDPHIRPIYSLMKVGYYAYGTGVLERGYEYGTRADIRVGEEVYVESPFGRRLMGDVDLMVWELELFGKLLEEFLGNLKGRLRRRPIVLYDGSFSLSYALNYSRDERERLTSALWGFINKVRELGAVPVGVYHTLSRALVSTIIRGVMCGDKPACSACARGFLRRGLKPPCRRYLQVSDSAFLRGFLEIDHRSPTFQVINELLEDKELYGFYLRSDAYNILRVEFPGWVGSNGANEIHNVLVSQISLARNRGGEGYPYALMRAHENVVIRSVDRELVENIISRKLERASKVYGRPLRLRRTSKSSYKRWAVI